MRGGRAGLLPWPVRLLRILFPGNPARKRENLPTPAKAKAAPKGGSLNRGSQQRRSGSSRVGVVHSLHSKKEFDAFVAATPKKTLIVVDFFATWCGPCQQIAPKVAAMAANYNHVKFVKVDVDECKDVQQQFGVTSMPTFKFLKGGKEVESMSGADENGLREKVQAKAHFKVLFAMQLTAIWKKYWRTYGNKLTKTCRSSKA
jgi:thioredoxin